jgi:hypothetical protein
LSKSRVERDSDVFAFDESSIIQALPKGIDNICEAGSRGASEKCDHRHRRLLRARRERGGPPNNSQGVIFWTTNEV